MPSSPLVALCRSSVTSARKSVSWTAWQRLIRHLLRQPDLRLGEPGAINSMPPRDGVRQGVPGAELDIQHFAKVAVGDGAVVLAETGSLQLC